MVEGVGRSAFRNESFIPLDLAQITRTRSNILLPKCQPKRVKYSKRFNIVMSSLNCFKGSAKNHSEPTTDIIFYTASSSSLFHSNRVSMESSTSANERPSRSSQENSQRKCTILDSLRTCIIVTWLVLLAMVVTYGGIRCKQHDSCDYLWTEVEGYAVLLLLLAVAIIGITLLIVLIKFRDVERYEETLCNNNSWSTSIRLESQV